MEGDGWPKQPYLGKSNHSAFSNTGLPWNKTLPEISNPFSRQHESRIDRAGFDVLNNKKERKKEAGFRLLAEDAHSVSCNPADSGCDRRGRQANYLKSTASRVPGYFPPFWGCTEWSLMSVVNPVVQLLFLCYVKKDSVTTSLAWDCFHKDLLITWQSLFR